MADLVFAFDPALDRPLPVPEAAPPAVAETVGGAVAAAFEAAVAAAGRASALVLLGRVLDPLRASPAQAAVLRRHVTSLADSGCRTVFVADDTPACHDLARMLGEPPGLCFVTPLAGCEFDVRGIAVEIVSAHGPLAAVSTAHASPGLRRRIVVGCDGDPADTSRRTDPDDDAAGRIADPFAVAVDAAPAWAQPGTFWVWGSRRPRHLPPGVHALPALQSRDDREPAGSCAALALVDRTSGDRGPAGPLSDWRGSWREIPTHRVAWRTLAVESQAGGDEELATAIWSALEAHPEPPAGTLEVVRVAVACGTSVARRVRVGEIAAETLARLRQLHDPRAPRLWVREVFADPHESLAPLGHARSGGRPGTTTSFSSALADIVADLEQRAPFPGGAPAATPDREAGWLALELVESI